MSLLPTERSIPESDLSKFTFLIYGGEGIGKTTFVNQIEEKVLIGDTEKGSKFQSAFTVDIPDWTTFNKVVDEFLRGDHEFTCFAIDTVGHLIQSCIQDCVTKLNIEHPSEGAWGRGWDACKKAWLKPIHKLQHSKYGLWFVSHAAYANITSAGKSTGRQYAQPEMPGFISKLVYPICDFIFYADTKKTFNEETKIAIETRILKTQNSHDFKAKCRMIAELPKEIPLQAHIFKPIFLDAMAVNSTEATTRIQS